MNLFLKELKNQKSLWMLLIGTQIIVKNSNITEKNSNNDFFGAAPRGGKEGEFEFL